VDKHTKYNRSEKGLARYRAYEKTPAGILRKRRHRLRKAREKVVNQLEVLNGTQ
jgi:hypothetical protein